MEPVFFIVPRRQAEAKKSVLMFQVMRLSIIAMASTKIHWAPCRVFKETDFPWGSIKRSALSMQLAPLQYPRIASFSPQVSPWTLKRIIFS